MIELENILIFINFIILPVSVIARCLIYEIFADQFDGITFSGQFSIPSRPVVISEVRNPWIRIPLYMLKFLISVGYTSVAISIIALIIGR